MDDNWSTYLGNPFRETLEGAIGAGDTTELSFDPLEAREIWSVNHIGVLVADNGATRYHVLVGPIGNQVNIHSSGTITADVLDSFHDGFYIFEGQYITVSIVGGTEGDKITIVAEGAKRWRKGAEVPIIISG